MNCSSCELTDVCSGEEWVEDVSELVPVSEKEREEDVDN